MSETHHIDVYIDGGCRNNGTPDASGYCSVRIEGRKNTLYSIDLANATTNNQAEYGALLCALDLLAPLLFYTGPAQIKVHFFTDSALLVNQVWGSWKIKNEHLRKLHSAVMNGLEAYSDAKVEITGGQAARDVIVEKLGH
jgi:ribonuclease HI